MRDPKTPTLWVLTTEDDTGSTVSALHPDETSARDHLLSIAHEWWAVENEGTPEGEAPDGDDLLDEVFGGVLGYSYVLDEIPIPDWLTRTAPEGDLR